MRDALGQTLAMVADAAAGMSDPWWIIGSAAVVLHGCKVPQVRDVDLLMSAADADRFLRAVGETPRSGTGDDRFRSMIFGVWGRHGGRSGPPIPVEAFGGFELAVAGSWRPVAFDTRETISVGGRKLYVPSRAELVRLLQSFGRPKDLERARLLGE